MMNDQMNNEISDRDTATGQSEETAVENTEPEKESDRDTEAVDETDFIETEPAVSTPIPVYTPPPQTVKTKHLTNRALAVLSGVMLVLAIAIAVLMFFSDKIAPRQSVINGESAPPPLPDKVSGGLVEINIERVPRPVLPDESYEDPVTGKFTSVGVAEYVLPSIALVKVYDDNVYTQIGAGSGVIMTANGYIITNAHVIEGGNLFSVQLSSGKVYEAVPVGSDSKQDVAVLKIEAEGLTPATFGKSSDVKLGEEIAVIASSGQTPADAVTFGNVSNVARQVKIESGDTVTCIQIDAAVNPGNSGGPVVNMYGQVIGLVDSKKIGITNQYNTNIYEGIGYALQIGTVLSTAESIIEYGYSQTSVRVGILYVAVDDLSASYYGVESGLLVESIDPTCSISKSGLMPGDIITVIDGVKVLSPASILEATAGKKPGDTATFEFIRRDITESVNKYSGTFTYEPVIPFPSNESFGETQPAE
jgi:serine protease Do